MFAQELAPLFAPDGPLARAFTDFRARPQQVELAEAIEQALREQGVLVAEAGTGTGKTWAYLVPLLMGGHRAIISTGTRTLQDQLFHRDIPALCQALDLSTQVALLKGRSNYLCHYHFDAAGKDEGVFGSPQEVAQFEQIRHFMQQTQTGDKSELAAVPEQAPIWHKVTSTRENCLGQDCPFIQDCFVYKARRRAQEADLVVINHALFMADRALREEGITDLLPEVQAIVFDEAHHLPETATRFLGQSVSSYQLMDFSVQLAAIGQAHARGIQAWDRLAEGVKTAVAELRLLAQPVQKQNGQKSTFDNLPHAEQMDAAVAELLEHLAQLIGFLAPLEGSHAELRTLHRSAIDLHGRLFLWTQPDRSGQVHENNLLDSDLQAQLALPAVRWLECSHQMLRFHRAPLTVDHVFQAIKEAQQAWIFTSATLSVRGDFSHFLRQLGLHEARTCSWPSPFNYPEQAALFVPQHMPLPHQRDFNARFVELLWPLIEATEGGVLVLCTTLRSVREIATLLQDKNDKHQGQRQILQQGEQSRGQLLQSFGASGPAVLVGSASFWEGVDFPGDALTLVAIDKLPFAPPDDPVLSARIEQCKREGGNPFMTFQLPEAAIALKQGAGRLIRSERDHGVLMIGDIRLVEKPYGRRLWQGLPPFTRTRVLEEALAFVQKNKATPVASPDE